MCGNEFVDWHWLMRSREEKLMAKFALWCFFSQIFQTIKNVKISDQFLNIDSLLLPDSTFHVEFKKIFKVFSAPPTASFWPSKYDLKNPINDRKKQPKTTVAVSWMRKTSYFLSRILHKRKIWRKKTVLILGSFNISKKTSFTNSSKLCQKICLAPHASARSARRRWAWSLAWRRAWGRAARPW